MLKLYDILGEAPPNLIVHKFIVLADHFPYRPDLPEVESCCRWHPLLLYLGQPIGTDSVLPEARGGTEVRILCVVKAICGMKPIGLGI